MASVGWPLDWRPRSAKHLWLQVILALPPRVAPNIMAMKTGKVVPGQSVKPAASATSGTASTAPR
jgi:hypothetical protein